MNPEWLNAACVCCFSMACICAVRFVFQSLWLICRYHQFETLLRYYSFEFGNEYYFFKDWWFMCKVFSPQLFSLRRIIISLDTTASKTKKNWLNLTNHTKFSQPHSVSVDKIKLTKPEQTHVMIFISVQHALHLYGKYGTIVSVNNSFFKNALLRCWWLKFARSLNME